MRIPLDVCIHAAGIIAALILASTAADARTIKAGDLVIEQPWARATPPGAEVAGGYLTIENKGPSADKLVGGSFEASAGFEIHDMSTEGGVMRMRQIDGGLEIPPGGSVSLDPSGKHIMFTGLKHGIKKGQSVEGTLVFEKAGTVKVEFDVESIGAKGPGAPGGSMQSMPGMKM